MGLLNAKWVLPPHAAEVMVLFGFPHGADTATGGLWWRSYDDGEIKLFADCSDLFMWGTADIEEIVAEDMPLLRTCLDDLRSVKAEHLLSDLFAARKRGLRPMTRWFQLEREEVGALFPDAAGSESDESDG